VRRTGEVLAIGAGLITALLIATDAIPLMRGPESWQWARRALDSPFPLLSVVAVFLATAAVAFRVRRVWGEAPDRRRVPLLGAAVLLLFAQMVLLTAVEPGGLSNVPRRVKDPAFTSYHTIAENVGDPVDFLRRYHRIQRRFPIHGPSQPPGRVLYFWSVTRVVGPEAGPAVAGFLLMAIGALAVVPLVVLVGGRCAPGAAGAAVLLMAGLPSFLLFTPETDHLILLLSLTAAALVAEGLRHASRPRATGLCLAGGLVAGVCLFVSFTTFAALFAWSVAFAGMLVLARWRGDPVPTRGQLVRLAFAGVAGFAVVPAITTAVGMNWPAVFRESSAAAERFQNVIFGREYSTWVIGNLWDFVLFLGPPLAIAWTVRIHSEWGIIRRRPREEEHDGRWTIPFGIVLLGMILLLDLSGKIRGETGRIWMFLMPLAVAGVASSPWARRDRVLGALAGAQLLVLLALRMYVNVPG
jgi:hypothetical protein